MSEPQSINRAPYTYHLNDQDNYEEEALCYIQHVEDVLASESDKIKCWVFQFEVSPDTQRVHVQGYLRLQPGQSWKLKRFKKAVGFNTLRAHLALPCRGSDTENRDYCTKDESRLPGTDPWEHGTFDDKKQGQRSDLMDAADIIKQGGDLVDVATSHPGSFIRYHRGFAELKEILRKKERLLAWPGTPNPEGRPICDFRWYYGPSGSGKTRAVYDEFTPSAVYSKCATNKWFDGYDPDKHKCILIDDYRPNPGLPYTELLSLLDIYPKSVERKLGTLHLGNSAIIVTSNYPWWEQFHDERNPSSSSPGANDLTPLSRRLVGRSFNA